MPRMKFVKLRSRNLAFIDTETGGLIPGKNPILEIAAVIVNPQATRVLEEWSARIWPFDVSTCSPRALEVNKFYEKGGTEEWAKTGIPLPTALDIFNRITAECVLAGHNVSYDISMLTAAMLANDKFTMDEDGNKHVELGADYHKIDTASAAWPLFTNFTGMRTISLDNIRTALGWSTEGNHSALQDAKDSLRVFQFVRSLTPPETGIVAAAARFNPPAPPLPIPTL